MNEPDNSSFSIWAVREVDHLFTRFARYTRFVLFSKWFLGVFAILLMTSLIAYPLITKNRSGMRVSFIGTSVDPAQASNPVMNHPEYQGTDDKGDQYRITGTRAVQQTPELIVIEQVDGQLIKANGSFTTLHADRAEYRKAEKFITLIGNVTITDKTGYVFTTSQATVNTANMDIDGDQPVEGTGPQGNLLATGFKIRNNGSDITFGGNGRVTLHLDKLKAEK